MSYLLAVHACLVAVAMCSVLRVVELFGGAFTRFLWSVSLRETTFGPSDYSPPDRMPATPAMSEEPFAGTAFATSS